MLAEVARVLAQHQISISSVIQHEAVEGDGDGDVVPLVIMTHTAPTGSFRATVAELDRLGVRHRPERLLPRRRLSATSNVARCGDRFSTGRNGLKTGPDVSPTSPFKTR